MAVKINVNKSQLQICSWYSKVIVNQLPENIEKMGNLDTIIVQGSLIDLYGNVTTYYYDGISNWKIGNYEGAEPIEVLPIESDTFSRNPSIEFLYGKYPVLLEDTDGITQVSNDNLDEFISMVGSEFERIALVTLPTSNDGRMTNPQARYVYFLSKFNTVFRASGFSWGYSGEGVRGLIKACEICGFNNHNKDIIGFRGNDAIIDQNGFHTQDKE